ILNMANYSLFPDWGTKPGSHANRKLAGPSQVAGKGPIGRSGSCAPESGGEKLGSGCEGLILGPVSGTLTSGRAQLMSARTCVHVTTATNMNPECRAKAPGT